MKSTPTHSTLDNKALIARQDALEAAIDLYGYMLLGYIRRMTQDYHLAEDILQMLWLHVFENFTVAQFSHVPLLRRKARQLVIDEARKRGTRSFVETVEELPEVDGSHVFREAATPEQERALKESFFSIFHGAIFTEPEKDAFWLSERYQYTIKEISEHLHIPQSTIHDWVNKVKRECARCYDKESI
jgi:RNA polymerase sigma factor (sigma-70 family)